MSHTQVHPALHQLHRIAPHLHRGALWLIFGLVGMLMAILVSSRMAVNSLPYASLLQNISPTLLSGSVNRADSLLGNGFTGGNGQPAAFSATGATNASLQAGGEYAGTGYATTSGANEALALLFNIKDGIKYVAGSIAILMIIISAASMIIARDEGAIKKARQGLIWSIIALLLIFIIDVLVIGFFGGGDVTHAPGSSPLVMLTHNPDGSVVIAPNQSGAKVVMATITQYITVDIRAFFETLKVLASVCAILFMFLSGLWMVVAAGNEENINKAKKYLFHVLTAFVAFIMMDAFIFQVIYPTTVGGTIDPACTEYLKQSTAFDIQNAAAGARPDLAMVSAQQATTCQSAAQLAAQSQNLILGGIRFFETIIGAISVFFIVYAGIRIIGAFGNQGVIDKEKKTLIWSLAGIGVIMLSENVVLKFFFVTDFRTGNTSTNLAQGFVDMAGIANFLVSFVGVLSMVTMLIAGFLWITNMGNADAIGKAKKMMLGAIMGVILSIAAHAGVATLLSTNSNGPATNSAIVNM